MTECDHCGTSILLGVEPIEGANGKYCRAVCRYDAEILGGDIQRPG